MSLEHKIMHEIVNEGSDSGDRLGCQRTVIVVGALITAFIVAMFGMVLAAN